MTDEDQKDPPCLTSAQEGEAAVGIWLYSEILLKGWPLMGKGQVSTKEICGQSERFQVDKSVPTLKGQESEERKEHKLRASLKS